MQIHPSFSGRLELTPQAKKHLGPKDIAHIRKQSDVEAYPEHLCLQVDLQKVPGFRLFRPLIELSFQVLNKGEPVGKVFSEFHNFFPKPAWPHYVKRLLEEASESS